MQPLQEGWELARYRVLAFDGGGIRGVLTATLLSRLVAEVPALIPNTNLFAGTSSGSFIALGLASGMMPEQVAGIFSPENGRYIFTPSFLPILRPKYDNTHLAAVLGSIFPIGRRLGDLGRRVLALSFQVTRPDGGSWSPVYFHNYPGSPVLEEPVVDVALSSSAAPIYFPSFQDRIDGGMVASNPAVAAIAIAVDAQAGGQSLDDLTLLSIGSGSLPQEITADTNGWGALQWALYPEPPFPLFSIMGEGVISVDTFFASRLLGNRFFRLNPELPESIPLDDYGRIPDLMALAQKTDLTPVIEWLSHNWL